MIKRLLILVYCSSSAFSQTKTFLAPVMPDSLWGFIDLDGKMIIEPKFTDVAFFEEGIARVAIKQKDSLGIIREKWGYIDKTGRYIIEPKFIHAGLFKEGLARVAILQKDSMGFERQEWGYIDKTGKYLIKPKYGIAYDFNDGYAAAAHEQWVYVNTKGEEVIKERELKGIQMSVRFFADVQDGEGCITIYELATCYRVNLKTKKVNESGFLGCSSRGDNERSPEKQQQSDLSDGIYAPPFFYNEGTGHFKKGYSLYDDTIPPYLGVISNEAPNKYEVKYGFAVRTDDGEKKSVIKPTYNFVSTFSEGLAYFENDTLKGFLNKKGDIAFVLKYLFIENFYNHRAAVIDTKTGKIGYINAKNEEVIKPTYNQAGDFHLVD